MILHLPPPGRWLLLAGMPRSGTTFAAKILSTPLSVDYIHEPFNPDCGMAGIDTLLVHTAIGASSEPAIRVEVQRLKRYETKLRTGHYERDSMPRRLGKRIIGSRGPFYFRLARVNPLHTAALVKEPVGCLLLEYLVSEHDFVAALLIRHPLGVIQSFERLGWDANRHLDALRTQESFAVNGLPPEDAELLSGRWDDPATATAVLWRVLNRALYEQARRTATPVVLHEDLSCQPTPAFQALFSHFGLPWSKRVERRLKRATSGNRSLASSGAAQQLERASAAIHDDVLANSSKQRRTLAWQLTGPVASRWYPKESFGL